MSIFKDIAKAAKKIPGTVSSAVTGKKGLLGSKGTLGLLAKGKIAKAAKATGAAVSKVVSNPVIQASFPIATVPTSIVSGAAAKGPKGALAAAKKFSKNPVFKAELAVAGVVFPPAAPASAAGIAAMEATSRVVDGIRSGNPAKIAAAAVQLAGTKLLAAQGNADAKRALTLMKDVDKARKIALGKEPGAMGPIQAAAKQGNAKAKAALELIQGAAVRNAAKVAASPKAPPKKKAAARKLLTTAQAKKPGLTAGTLAALKSPKGVRIGDFSLLATGRILYRGKPVRKAA